MRSRVLQAEARLIGTAIMFLTRLPVGSLCSADPEDLSRSTRWFPLVGLLIASLLSIVYLVCSVWLPTSVCIVLLLIAGVRLTGAFHEDGLADVADSAGAFDIDSKLSIMRDSRLGTYGSLALILLIALKGVLFFELSLLGDSVLASGLILAHVWSRWSSVWLMARHDYARPEAANKVVAEGITTRRLLEATLVALLIIVPIVLIVSPVVMLLVPAVALLAAGFCGWRFEHALGGITGDCLGAGNQIVEITVLMAVLVVSR